MKSFKIILFSLFIISQTACSGDNAQANNTDNNTSNSNQNSKAVKDKVNVSVEIIGNGKNWMGSDGCQAKFVYTNTMDADVSVHIIRYEVIHTKEKFLKTGLASKRTIKPDETRKIDTSFSELTCDEVTGLEIQAYTCTTKATGADCTNNINFINTSDVKLTVKTQK